MSQQARQFLETYRHYLVPEGPQSSEAEAAAISIVDRYTEPWRFHHVVPHLGMMGVFLSDNIEKIKNPRRVFLATIGHDAVYVPQLFGGVNEELSAQLFVATMSPFHEAQIIADAAGDIRATVDHDLGDGDSDRAYFLDADMLIVGAEEEVFDAYDANIGSEFSFVPVDRYTEGRKSVLKSFNERQIFITPEAVDLYEDQAHANIERAIKRLN